MKKSFFILFFALVCFLQAQEEVSYFHSDIQLDTTSVITVSEKIDIVSEGKIFKRGIVRYLPLYKTDSVGNETQMNYRIIKVEKENQHVNHFTKKSGEFLEIYVGDKDTFLNNGPHSYTITYSAENTIGFFTDYDELYWNVNGFGWDFTLPQVSATITFPKNAVITQNACYTGSYGSRERNCTSTIDRNTIHFISEPLYPGQNLTVAAGIAKGVLQPPPPPPPPTWFETYGLLLIGLFFTLFLSVYYVSTWKKYGIDPPKPVVYPQFEAPENLSPSSVGILHKESYHDDLVTTALVNLAVKGYLQIKEEEKKGFLGLRTSTVFRLIKLKEDDDALPKEEKVLLSQLFRNRDEVKLDGEYQSFVGSAVQKFKDAITQQHKPLINEGNNYKFLVIPLLLFAIFLVLSIFIGIKLGQEEIFLFIFGGLGFLPFAAFIFAFVHSWLKLKWQWVLMIFLAIPVISVLIFSFGISWNKQNINNFSIAGFFVFAAITFAFYKYFIKRPAEEKLRLQSLIDGFKMYLGAAEEKQLQHFNSPKLTPEIFEKYLPYAIALDAEDIWGKKFQNYLIQSAMQPNAYQNQWYVGNNFNAINFGHLLNSQLSNSISKASTPPSSSGGGSSGGGFSGGGGGGGGGGGW